MEFTIDPYQGAAALFAGCALKGYKLIKMERKKTKVTCWYEKL